MATDAESKYRYFAGFVYRHDKDGNEQITEQQLHERLLRSFGDFAVSPLHAADDEQTDEHWHVIYKHPSSVRLEPARNFMIGIDGVSFFNDYIIPLHHPANYQRYLIHLDNPDKEQFPGGAKAITTINNFPLNLSRELSLADKLEIQKQIESFAREFNIFEYAAMTVYLSEHGLDEHYFYFTTHTHHFGKYLDSLRYSATANQEVDLDA